MGLKFEEAEEEKDFTEIYFMGVIGKEEENSNHEGLYKCVYICIYILVGLIHGTR